MSTLAQTAAALLAIAAILTALKIIWGFGPVQWIIDRIVEKPIEEALDRRIDTRIEPYMKAMEEITARMETNLGAIKTELTTNGGDTLKDIVLDTQNRAVSAERAAALGRREISAIAVRVGHIERAIQSLSNGKS